MDVWIKLIMFALIFSLSFFLSFFLSFVSYFLRCDVSTILPMSSALLR